MHREIRTTDNPFRQERPLALYFLTAIVGLLLAADLWPPFAGWLAGQGVQLPTWKRELFGYRYALLAAIVGGARVLYNSLDALPRQPARERRPEVRGQQQADEDREEVQRERPLLAEGVVGGADLAMHGKSV